MKKDKNLPDRDDSVLLDVKNVTMKFTKYDVRVDSLKELVTRAFKGDLKHEKFVCLRNISFQIRKGEAERLKSRLRKVETAYLKEDEPSADV